ncbi:hypothetical protein C6P46_003566 [Rhodotorula mucilaginosa]|uniref:Tubulin-specific chaperone D n=1 Tax=Rhodotorula mucilaginosa TaxID=5537 RepID=A0A9P6WAI6_RHOMI|nr:hypothetical protein C6P46_003566 [Rhodotorula mucilaginosa]
MSNETDGEPELASFTRAGEFLAGVEKLTDLDLHSSPDDATDRCEQREVEQLCNLLDEYQEQPYLLDRSLESMVSPVVFALRGALQADSSSKSSRRIARLAKLLYWLTKVRGSKTIVRFFPHDVTDLSFLLDLLSSPSDLPSTTSASEADRTGPLSTSWELRYCLLLWLSVCIRLPFSFRLLAPGAEDKIRHVGLRWLRTSGKESDAAAQVVGRYFSRDDVDIVPLLDLCEITLSSPEDDFILLPLLGALCIVLACSGPNKLHPVLPRLYGLLALLPEANDSKTGAALAKLRGKVAGRIALAYLTASASSSEVGTVSEEVEVIVGELIEGLAHPDSIPRYTSAKYLARISLQSPPDLAIQVVETVLAEFENALLDDAQKQGEGRVQGACLALGEMARCGVLARLPAAEKDDVVKRVLGNTLQALRYDHLSALHVVGASVRDSAAYVLWSLARTMPASSIDVTDAQKLAEHLLCTACLDREGIFSHGISSLRATDFYTVSVRYRAYLLGAVEVASYEEYRPAILAHLTGETATGSVDTGIAHYDAEIRSLSAKAIGKIAENKAGAVVSALVRQQLVRLADVKKDAHKLEGVLLALASLAEATAALSDLDARRSLQAQIFAAVCGLYPTTRLLRSQRIVFEASMLALAASASETIDGADGSDWFGLVHLACDRAEATAHQAAGAALSRMSPTRDCQSALNSLLADLDSRNSGRQQGAAALIGSLDFDEPGIANRAEAVITRLCDFVRRDGRAAAATVEARRNGVTALGRVLERCLPGQNPSLSPSAAMTAYEALLLGFSDFTSDSRGDVGSWIRIATTAAWSRLIRSARLPERTVHRAVAAILRLALERLDAVRTVAGAALLELSDHAGPNAASLTELDSLRDAKETDDASDWRDIEWASSRILPLLRYSQYRAEIMEGVVCTNTQYYTNSALCDYVATLPAPGSDTPAESQEDFILPGFLSSLVALAKARFGNNRVFIPLLFTLAELAEAGSFDAATTCGGPEECTRSLRDLLKISCSALEKTKSRARLSATCRVLAAFVALPSVAADAATRVPIFLRHSQPWVRQQTAEHLFSTVSAFFPSDVDQELETLLTETDWTTDEALATGTAVAELLAKRVGHTNEPAAE